MSEVAVNEIINRFAEEFVNCLKERPKAVYIPFLDDEYLVDEQIDGVPRNDLSGVLLVDLPHEILDELVGIPLDFGLLRLGKVDGSSAYVLAGGYDEPDYILVYSARL